MNLLQTPARPDWKEFLLLGEALLKLTSTADQCSLIQQTIRQRIQAECHLWLAAPYYPLPNESQTETLPGASVPSAVRQAFTQTKPIYTNSSGPTIQHTSCPASQAAIPLLAQGDLLGVIYAWREQDLPFGLQEINFLQGIAEYAALAMQVSRQSAIKSWRYEQLNLVRSVSNQIANVLDLDELYQQVTTLIQKTFKFYFVAIFTIEENSRELCFRASARGSSEFDSQCGIDVHLGEGLVGYAASSGNEVIANNVDEEPLYRPLEILPYTRGEAVLPLRVQDRILGVLDVQADKPDGFHEVDLLVLRALADNIALRIEGVNLFQDLQWHDRETAVVNEVTYALNSILDLETLLKEVVRLIQKRFNYPFVHIFTVYPMRRLVIYRMGTGKRSQAMRKAELSYPLDDPLGIIPAVARTGKSMMVNDVTKNPLYRPAKFPPDNTCAEMVIPLRFGKETLGVLDIQSDQLNVFNERVLMLFEALGASIATALHNAMLFRTEKWRRQVSESFRDISSQISADITLDQLFHAILKELERNLPCEAQAIWLLEDIPGTQSPVLQLVATQHVDADTLNHSLRSSPPAAQWLLSSLDQPMPLIHQKGEPPDPLGMAMNYPSGYSSIAAPMRFGNQALGILTLVHRTQDRYGSEAQSITATFASSAAMAIQNARLFSEAQSQAWTATVLLQSAEASREHENLDDLLSSMVRLTPLMAGVQKCAFFLWNQNRSAFVGRAAYGFELSEDLISCDGENAAPAFASLCSSLALVRISNPGVEFHLPELVALPSAARTVLIPMSVHGNLLGAFLVVYQCPSEFRMNEEFEQQTLSILQGIAHQTAVAVENLQLTEDRQEESYATAVLLQVAQAVASQNKLSEIFETILNLLPILLGIDTSIIYLWEPHQKVFTPSQVNSILPGLEHKILNARFYPGEFDLLQKVFQTGELHFSPLLKSDMAFENWPDLPCLSLTETPDLVTLANNGLLMGLPLSVKGESYGILAAVVSRGSSASWERRLEIINGIAQQIALAIQNDRLTSEMVERERFEREMQLARQIQKTFLPDELPLLPGWDIDARWQTALTVGGDFYDIFRLGKKRLALVIADVSDKGMPAALYMTVTRTLIRANSHPNSSPAAVLERVNNLLLGESQNGMFVTAVVAILDLETGLLTYANAGHNRPLLFHGHENRVEILPKGGMALAVLEHTIHQNHVIQLHPEDLLLFYTDGVTDTLSPRMESFGDARLIDILQTMACCAAETLLEQVERALAEFRQEALLYDDVTLMALRRLPEINITNRID